MNDLISRSALLAEYDRQHEGAPGRARALIESAPAVDAVPVIRCKDCKHYNKQMACENGKCCTINAEYDPDVGVWYGFTMYPTPDFFCGDGERRTDADL